MWVCFVSSHWYVVMELIVILELRFHRLHCKGIVTLIFCAQSNMNSQRDSGKLASAPIFNILFCTTGLKILREILFSPLVSGARSYMMKFGCLTKDFGPKITAFGRKFKRLTGKMSCWKTNLRRACRRTFMGSLHQRRCIGSLLFLGRYVSQALNRSYVWHYLFH
jgi:hypothetical protein